MISHTPSSSTKLSSECLCVGHSDTKKWLECFFLSVFFFFFLFGRSVVLGSTREVLLDNSIFPLTACHCLSAHGNKSFSICHSYLSLHLLLILHCFFPPCFSSSTLIFYYFDFFPKHQSSFRLFGGLYFYIFSAFGYFFLSAHDINIFLIKKKLFQ